ncbi:MAG TPA: pantoate--beta-alanine ligase [Gemmatimonadaceae bacterium]|jgi:pantoate--beta-alanine ligase
MPTTATSLRRLSGIAELRDAIAQARKNGARVGFVPTMGALHRGHLSLVDRARAEADLVVMSIFVNPLQFGPAEDFSRYPRPIEHDEGLAADSGVDLLFTPGADDMYREGRVVTVTAGDYGKRWEGAVRPGHFDGVLTVVAKLFNIVQADVAVFGRKDLQQAALVKMMVHDLDFPVRIVVAPTVRDADGLALSSRNTYLSDRDRGHALSLIRSLRAASALFGSGERDARRLEAAGRDVIAAVPEVRLDYFAIVNPQTLEEEAGAQSGSAAIVAAHVGSTHLIDNIILGENDQD